MTPCGTPRGKKKKTQTVPQLFSQMKSFVWFGSDKEEVELKRICEYYTCLNEWKKNVKIW